MIPLKDIDRRPSRFPSVTMLIIGLNVLVFLLEIAGGAPFIERWALIPSDLAAGGTPATMVTAMFLHGGLLHIAGNMIYLWAFGPEIEDMMGKARFSVFYLAGGLVAFGAQVAGNMDSPVPALGASGAIAAVMGAFLVTFPHDRIRSIVFIGIFVTIYVVPAVILVGFWFVIQLFSEIGSLRRPEAAGVAYLAHIGGFVFGAAFGRLFEIRRRRYFREPE